MKLVVQVRLLPDAAQAAALASTLRSCNEAANWVSQVAFERRTFHEYALRKHTYGNLKDRGLGAQAAQHVIKKVVNAYTSFRASFCAGEKDSRNSERRAKAEAVPVTFRVTAAHPFDDRCLSWQHDRSTVSIWTVNGRLKHVRYAGHPNQVEVLRRYRRGETDLVCRDGMWLLLTTCEVPEADQVSPTDWIGVDRGIVHIATTSDGHDHQGRRLLRYRRWAARKRAELQAKGTRSAARRLKRRTRREARHASHVNHKVSKEIVAVAQRTVRGIALEELRGIRDRVRLPRDQRATLSGWSFHHLGHLITYKARRAGVPVILVSAHYTSQMCPRCGHTARNNRPARGDFCCRRCGLAGPADHVAAVNVRNRARRAWVFANTPAPT
ncbi:RNA-guided endonuclease InsQ/TnpB family protein [Actinocrispum wychmicini]|uniref:IS605 OrfB family transposase n=1 Tax=Actinocrispum wychmicini TaxID=1213861 RepID=A0A4R2IVX3_9PSEU|nr:RNA-guided endonuclease TnpB family protein [Actinocrispum wychmicini]TCO48952.1 IS605 OrfB family transposase [Actinocrispum wychmicini]